MSVVSDGGEWEPLHGKVKWGLFFGDLPRTVSAAISGSLRRVREHGFTGTVSFDEDERSTAGDNSLQGKLLFPPLRA